MLDGLDECPVAKAKRLEDEAREKAAKDAAELKRLQDKLEAEQVCFTGQGN